MLVLLFFLYILFFTRLNFSLYPSLEVEIRLKTKPYQFLIPSNLRYYASTKFLVKTIWSVGTFSQVNLWKKKKRGEHLKFQPRTKNVHDLWRLVFSVYCFGNPTLHFAILWMGKGLLATSGAWQIRKERRRWIFIAFVTKNVRYSSQ